MQNLNHGIEPLEYRVLVKPEVIEERTPGGIIIPETVKDKQRFAKETGIVVEAGALAFSDPDWTVAPKPGQRVLYDKYAGILLRGADGQEYRLINDKDIAAILHFEGKIS